jgi:hypothetical protein
VAQRALIEHLRVRSSGPKSDPDTNCPLVLKAETETCMKLLGVEKVSELGPKHVCHSLPTFILIHALTYYQVNSRAVERDIYDGHAGLEKLGLWVKANL